MYTTTSTIAQWSGQALQFIWDSLTGFFYTANGSTFIVVFIILIGVVCLVVAGIKNIFPHYGKKL